MTRSKSFDERKAIRQDLIHKTLAAMPMTIQQVSEATKVNYVTARRDILDLKEKNLVFMAPHTTDTGAVLYQSREVKPMPELYIAAANKSMSILDIAKSYDPAIIDSTPIVKAIMAFYQTLVEVLEAARVRAEGNVMGEHLKDKEIIQMVAPYRKQLDAIEQRLESFLSLVTQLKTAKVWTPEDLSNLAEDEAFDPKLIREIWERLNREEE